MASAFTSKPNTLRLRGKRSSASHADPPLVEDPWTAAMDAPAPAAHPLSIAHNAYVPIPDSDRPTSRTPSPPTSDGWEVLSEPPHEPLGHVQGQCSQCKKHVQDLKAHAEECPDALMQCPSRPSCEAFVLRKNLKRHKDTCPFAQVSCGIASCEARLFRCQLAQHFTTEHAPGSNQTEGGREVAEATHEHTQQEQEQEQEQGGGNAEEKRSLLAEVFGDVPASRHAPSTPPLLPPPPPCRSAAHGTSSSPHEVHGARVDTLDEPLRSAPVKPRVERVRCPISPECEHLPEELMSMHVAKCPHKLVKCPNGCMAGTMWVKRSELSKHKKTCARESVPCVNTQCSATVPREEMRHHLAHECEHALVVCDYAQMGCGAAVPRGEMDAHHARCHGQHVSCLRNALARSAHDIAQLRRDTNALRCEVAKLRRKSALRSVLSTVSSAANHTGEFVADTVVHIANHGASTVADKVNTASAWAAGVVRSEPYFFMLLLMVLLPLWVMQDTVHGTFASALLDAWPFLHLMMMDTVSRGVQPSAWLALAVYTLLLPGMTATCLLAAPLVFMHSEIIVNRPLWRLLASVLTAHALFGMSWLFGPIPLLLWALRVCTAMLVLDRGMRDSSMPLPDHLPNIMMPVGLVVLCLHFLVFRPLTMLPRETEPFLLLCVLRMVTYINEDVERNKRVTSMINDVAELTLVRAQKHGRRLGFLLAILLHVFFQCASASTVFALIVGGLIARADLWAPWSWVKNVVVGTLLFVCWSLLPASGLVLLVMWADAVYLKSGMAEGLRKKVSVGCFSGTLFLALLTAMIPQLG